MCNETKPKIFRLLYWKRSDGLEKIILDGRMNGKKEKGRAERQWERDQRFNKPVTEVGRFAIGREHFRSAVVDEISNRISSLKQT